MGFHGANNFMIALLIALGLVLDGAEKALLGAHDDAEVPLLSHAGF